MKDRINISLSYSSLTARRDEFFINYINRMQIYSFKYYSIYFIILLFTCSCSYKQNLKPVTISSDLIRCKRIFASSTQALEERNEILLQTGAVDTTDEDPPINAAVINTSNSEILLTLQKSERIGLTTIENYTGNGYTLSLTFTEEKNKFGRPVYLGKFILQDSLSKSEFEVSGRDCNL